MSTIFDPSTVLPEAINTRFAQFMGALDDPSKEVMTVHDPLSKKQLEELELIREVSAELQRKKQEDMKKAAAQTAGAADGEEKTLGQKFLNEKAH